MGDQIVESPLEEAPQSPAFDDSQAQIPLKLKGRRRLLQKLQRISSSPSLSNMGMNPSSAYRTGCGGSISCISLASPLASYGPSYVESPSSANGSTAPTTLGDLANLETGRLSSGIRLIESEIIECAQPTSIPVPPSVRPCSKLSSPETCIPKPEADVEVTKKLRKRGNVDFWGDMPDEIKVEILRYLTPKEIVRCSAVSQLWYRMCFDGQLWTSLDASEFYTDIPAESLIKIITSAGPFVRDLNLRGCRQLRKPNWRTEALTKSCNNLVNASLEGCRIEQNPIQDLIVRNHRLAHLNISGLSGVTNTTCEIIAESCPQLELLNVSWCAHMDAQGLRRIVENCPKLKDLRASEIRGFEDKESMECFFNTNTLERLILNGCDSLTDNTLKVLCEGNGKEVDSLTGRTTAPPRKLRHLDLSRCYRLTDVGIKSLAENVPNLEGLQLSGCKELTDAALTDLISSVPKLTHLDLEEVLELTNTSLQNLAKAPCRDCLEHLSISYCEKLGDTGMLPVLKACPSLRNVEMDNTRTSDLVLAEAASVVRERNAIAAKNSSNGRPRVGLRMVVYDCQNVTWTGVREVLSRNAEIRRPTPGNPIPSYPSEIIQLKCFYGWQMTVEEHTKRVLRGDLAAASRLERKWAEYMVANEEAGAQGAGVRRRRRRAREAQMMHADEEEGGVGTGGVGRRRRARSGGCVVM
jgi:F-box and leucine-rich repeat protein 2/20